jgi:hypothetical protein
MLRRILSVTVLLAPMLSAWVFGAPAPGTQQGLPEKLPAPCFGLMVSSVRDGIVFTISHRGEALTLEQFIELGNKALEDSNGVRLWKAPLLPALKSKPEGTRHTFREWCYSSPLDSLHWRIAYDHIWAECGFPFSYLSYHIPLEDLPLLDTQNSEKGLAELRKQYRDDRAGTAAWYLTNFCDSATELLTWIHRERSGRIYAGPNAGEVECDFLPTGPKTWDGFVLFESKLTLWRCTQQPRDKDPLSPTKTTLPVKSEKCGEAINAGFQEPFFVYGKPEAPFFVTKSGKVFQCLYPKGKEPRVVKVWDDPKRQVRTILNDADTNRTFVAGPDPAEGEGQWFYFELTEKPEKKPFDRSAVTAHAQEPLQSALIFARFLVKEGLLKDKAQ